MARERDECPFCGEPIDSDAESCPHCGSDAETGWNPDAEYLSLELPEDDAEEEAQPPEEEVPADPTDSRARLARLLGPALVAGSWMAFILIGSTGFRPAVLVFLPGAYMAGCILAMSRLAPR